MNTDIPDKAREAAAREIAHVCADSVVADEVARAALAAAQPHMGGEPVAWRWRWKGHSAWHYGTHSANLEPGDFQPLYLAPPASPDVAALIDRARIKSAILKMGEPIAFGSDAAMIDELCEALSRLSQPGGRDDH